MEQTSRKKLAYFASEYSDEGVNRSSEKKVIWKAEQNERLKDDSSLNS